MLEPTDLARYRRETRAMIERAAADDPDSLALVYGVLSDAMASMPIAVGRCMEDTGYSWRDIARAFAIPLTTAYRRFDWSSAAAMAYSRLGGRVLESRVS